MISRDFDLLENVLNGELHYYSRPIDELDTLMMAEMTDNFGPGSWTWATNSLKEVMKNILKRKF